VLEPPPKHKAQQTWRRFLPHRELVSGHYGREQEAETRMSKELLTARTDF